MPDDGCKSIVDRIGVWIRDGTSRGEREAVRGHLAVCRRCRDLVEELVDVAGGLARVAA
ncbi:zf-HC2 domain-containing protein [Saccharothrix sp.]|uniref:zf-HC2 domain-containing protein n=1 Tax=Saccharothrix sp. TaxID=1873460 RepID=UPI0035C7FFA2